MERLKIHIIKGVMYSYISFWSVAENRYNRMRVLIDTGAAVTTFSEPAIKKLGYSLGKEHNNIRTAGGIISSHESTIPKVKIGAIEFANVEAHSNKDIGDYEIDCILGMNILSRFKITIDFDYNLITLDERKIVNC